MLGADTNILVRFLTRDDAVQAPLSLRLVTAADNQPIYLCTIVIVELVWVLTKVKRWNPAEVAEACRSLLDGQNFLVDDRELIADALADAEVAGCDLADALIARVNERAGCEATATFDADAQRLTRMVPVEART